MEAQPHRIPRVAITCVASGLLMMALFTTMWAVIAGGGLKGWIKYIELGCFVALVIAFVASAVYFFSTAKRFPELTDEADIARSKKDGKWFGIIFGAEGLGIFIGVNVVVKLGHPELTIPVLALVVGLHFFPLAKIFKRTIDYYIATWSTIVAILGVIFALNKIMTADEVQVFVGTGLALSTTCYGLYMMATGRGYIKRTPIDVQAAVL